MWTFFATTHKWFFLSVNCCVFPMNHVLKMKFKWQHPIRTLVCRISKRFHRYQVKVFNIDFTIAKNDWTCLSHHIYHSSHRTAFFSLFSYKIIITARNDPWLGKSSEKKISIICGHCVTSVAISDFYWYRTRAHTHTLSHNFIDMRILLFIHLY